MKKPDTVHLVQVPVIYEESGLLHICIYRETEDGFFQKTPQRPFVSLSSNIRGISLPQGSLSSCGFERMPHPWRSASVSFHYGRPMSYYEFARTQLKRNRMYVFSLPTLAARCTRLQLHQLYFRPDFSQQKFKLFRSKFMQATNLWMVTPSQIIGDTAQKVA